MSGKRAFFITDAACDLRASSGTSVQSEDVTMAPFLKALPLLVLSVLAGCYTMPEGPTVTALPGDARSASEFRTDNVDCRQYAYAQTDAATSASAGHAGRIASAAHGAAADAAPDRRDSTVGGGGMGSVIDGIDSAEFEGYGPQAVYNRAYVHCMYFKGNKVFLLARERWPAPRSPWPPDPEAYYSPLDR
jgi:hypothetical protein